MAIERTLSIIKPDAVAKNVIGQIYARFEAAGLKVVAAKMVHLSRGEAEQFYAVHKERPFFKDLVDFMISGPVVVQVLEGEGAILKYRDVMGASDITAPFVLESQQVRVEIGPITMTSKLVDGTFPDYGRVIPQANDKVKPEVVTSDLANIRTPSCHTPCRSLARTVSTSSCLRKV